MPPAVDSGFVIIPDIAAGLSLQNAW